MILPNCRTNFSLISRISQERVYSRTSNWQKLFSFTIKIEMLLAQTKVWQLTSGVKSSASFDITSIVRVDANNYMTWQFFNELQMHFLTYVNQFSQEIYTYTVSAQIEHRCSNFLPGFFGAVVLKFGKTAVIIKMPL